MQMRPRPRRRRCLAPGSAAFAVAAAALAPSSAVASISRTGFQNEYYQVPAFNGSRVLEQLEEGRYTEYLKVTWTQSVAVDSTGRVWVVDRNEHVIVEMAPSTRYVPWPALYVDYAGTRGMPGFMNGSIKQTRFDSPTGITVTRSQDPFFIFVADTNNHVIRKLNTKFETVTTVVGLAKAPGLRDGPAKDSRLRFPQSLGLDEAAENLMVLDNGRRIRHVRISLVVPTITTLVDGACRSISRYTLLTSVEMRVVGCHTDWRSQDTGDNDLSLHYVQMFCLGHSATCGERNHPALADHMSPQLLSAPATTSSTTTLYNVIDQLYR